MRQLRDEFSALRLGNAAALFERLRSFNAGVVLAAQSVEGLHDDPAERDRLLNSASTLIAHRLADPDPVVLRAGTIRRAERSHQLDVGGATGVGSLRLQDAYRIDPNELRSLTTGVAYVVSGGRAAKVAVAAARIPSSVAGSALPRGAAPPSSPHLEYDRQASPSVEVEVADATGEPAAGPVAPSEGPRANDEEAKNDASAGVEAASADMVAQSPGSGGVSPCLPQKTASPYAQGL